MKLYLKSGQVVELNDLHTIVFRGESYGVGKFYDSTADDKMISKGNIFNLCSHDKICNIEFYYNATKLFITTNNEIVGIEV